MDHPLPGPAFPWPAFALRLDGAGRVMAADPSARNLFGNGLGTPPPPLPCPPPGTCLDWTGAGGVWRLWTETDPDGSMVLRGLGVADLAAAGEVRQRQFTDIIDGATEGVAVAAAGRLVYVNPYVVGATAAADRARALEHAARTGKTARFAAYSQALDVALEATLAGFAAKGHKPAAP